MNITSTMRNRGGRMKTSEFIARVERLGFSVKEKKYTVVNEVWLIVCEVEHIGVMSVEKNTRYMIDTDYANFIHLDDDLREELFGLAVEYARTPIEEREMEKKYYLRLPIFGYDNENYLNLDRDTGKYLLDNKKDIAYYQTQFTQKEIDEMKKTIT